MRVATAAARRSTVRARSRSSPMTSMRALWSTACLLWLLGPGGARALQCAQRREMSPCTCERHAHERLELKCERVMESYAQIAAALAHRFPEGTRAELVVTHSALHDMRAPLPPLAALGYAFGALKLNYNNISVLSEEAFEGLEGVQLLSLADNELTSVPREVLRRTPDVRTLDLNWCKIRELGEGDLQPLHSLHYLLLTGNGLSAVHKRALPPHLKSLQLGVNMLAHLNDSVRHLDRLEILMLHANKLTTLDGQLPTNARRLRQISAYKNAIESMPKEISTMPVLDTLYLDSNEIRALNGVLTKAHALGTLNLSYNKIKHIAHDDLAEAKNLTNLDLGCNLLVSLNGSLRNLPSLKHLNLTRNRLSEFSMREIGGLKKLLVVDLTHNRIARLLPDPQKSTTEVLELRLSYNKLRALGDGGALSGVRGLRTLNASHNHIESVTGDDLRSLAQLRVLDLSHNRLASLDDAATWSLPGLEELHLAHNRIVALEKDFHGLPVLCLADLSHNAVESINVELVAKTRCSIHGVLGVLKIHLHENPVICEDNFPELNRFVETLHVRFYGECQRHAPSVGGVAGAGLATMNVAQQLQQPSLQQLQQQQQQQQPSSSQMQLNDASLATFLSSSNALGPDDDDEPLYPAKPSKIIGVLQQQQQQHHQQQQQQQQHYRWARSL